MSPLHSAAPSLGGGASNGAPMVVGCTSMSPIHTSASLVAAAGGVGSLSPPLHHSGASSLDDAAAAGDPFAALSAGAPLEVGLLTSAAAQYNLARLANMAEGPEDPETNPDGPVTMADLLLDPSLSVSAAEQNVLNNLTALAKLGSVSLNNAGTSFLFGVFHKARHCCLELYYPLSFLPIVQCRIFGCICHLAQSLGLTMFRRDP